MIEIVCPSCDARYQLPDGSIGPDGRNVSCSNCAHKWRAHVEEAAPQAAAQAVPQDVAPPAPSAPPPSSAPQASPPPQASAAPQPSAPPQPSGRPSLAQAPRPSSGASGPSALDPADAAAVAAALAVAGSSGVGNAGAAPAPASGDREQQMDAIRKMLADLKEGAEAADAAVPEPVAKAEPEAPPQPVRRRDSDDDSDTLKSRIDDLTKMGKAAKGEATQSGYDTRRLRKLHERRAKRLQKARERRGKSGAFMTGFTLVALVVITMVGLYVMKPQIVAASPGMGPAMDEYVVTVDRYRVELNEKTAEWRGWVTERIAKLRGEEVAGETTQTQ